MKDKKAEKIERIKCPRCGSFTVSEADLGKLPKGKKGFKCESCGNYFGAKMSKEK